MIIRNETKGTILTENAIRATSFMQKAFGLIIAKKGTAIVFQTRSGIHTFFMRYPIDILVLDKKNTVAAIKQNLHPYNIYLWNPKYQTIIELPPGTIAASQTTLFDKIVA